MTNVTCSPYLNPYFYWCYHRHQAKKKLDQALAVADLACRAEIRGQTNFTQSEKCKTVVRPINNMKIMS